MIYSFEYFQYIIVYIQFLDFFINELSFKSVKKLFLLYEPGGKLVLYVFSLLNYKFISFFSFFSKFLKEFLYLLQADSFNIIPVKLRTIYSKIPCPLKPFGPLKVPDFWQSVLLNILLSPTLLVPMCGGGCCQFGIGLIVPEALK